MTRPEIEALLEGAYFPDAETREAVIARVSEAIAEAKKQTAADCVLMFTGNYKQPLPKGPAND